MFRNTFLTVVAFLSLGSVAPAAIVYEFGQSNYDVVAGGMVDVDVYLVQDNLLGLDPVDLSTDGLLSAGVRVFFNDSPPTDPAEVMSLGDIVPNPLFDDAFVEATLDLVAGQSAGFADAVDFGSDPLFANRILLGRMRFTAGDVVGEVTNLRAERFDLVADNTLANDLALTSLDDITSPGFATITVTAVPEPSSLILLAVGGAGALIRRRQLNQSNCGGRLRRQHGR